MERHIRALKKELRWRRSDAGITQEELAFKCGTSQSAVCSWESFSSNRIPPTTTWKTLWDLLKIDIPVLLGISKGEGENILNLDPKNPFWNRAENDALLAKNDKEAKERWQSQPRRTRIVVREALKEIVENIIVQDASEKAGE